MALDAEETSGAAITVIRGARLSAEIVGNTVFKVIRISAKSEPVYGGAKASKR